MCLWFLVIHFFGRCCWLGEVVFCSYKREFLLLFLQGWWYMCKEVLYQGLFMFFLTWVPFDHALTSIQVSQELRSLLWDLIPELILSQKHRILMGPICNHSGVMSFWSTVNKVEGKRSIVRLLRYVVKCTVIDSPLNTQTRCLKCGNKMPTRCNRGFYCGSYCLLNMFRASLCPSSGTQEYYTVVAACGILCCGFFK